MFWYSLIYIILIIIAASGTKNPSLIRSNYEKDLENMNSDVKRKMICGIITVIVAILPIADNLAKPDSVGGFKYIKESPIFHVNYEDAGPLICIVLSWCFVIGWIIWMLANADFKHKNAEKLEQMISKEEQRQAIVAAKRAEEEKENNQVKEELTAKYGQPEQIVYILDTRLKNSFMVFPGAQSIYVQSKVIPYSQIVSCEVKDESYTTVTGTKQEVTKTSTGSMAGRAIVGAAIAGPLGAVVGGATAKKKTEVIDNTKTVTHHHYYVIITLADVSTPMVKIDCGKTNHRIAEKIKAILVGIISQKVSKPAAPKSIADELAKLAVLKEKGILTDEEFTQQKQLLLGAEQRPIELTAENQFPLENKASEVYDGPVIAEVEEWLKAGMPGLAAKKYQNAKGCTLEEAQDFVERYRADHGF